MATFNFTTGNPANLTGGAGASMSDIQGPFTDLQTFLNGQIGDSNLSASAALNENKLATGSNGLAKGSFSASRNAASSLATGAVVPFDTEQFDVSGWFDVTTNVGRYTPQLAGYYSFAWSIEVGVLGANAAWQAGLYKNGSPLYWGSRVFQVGSAVGPVSVGSVPRAIANGSTDFFEVRLFHNNGGSPALVVGSTTVWFNGGLAGRS